MMKGLPSETLVVIGDGGGCGIGGVGGELQELHAHFLIRRHTTILYCVGCAAISVYDYTCIHVAYG